MIDEFHRAGFHSPQSPSVIGLTRPVPAIEGMDPYAGSLFRIVRAERRGMEPSGGQRRSPVI